MNSSLSDFCIFSRMCAQNYNTSYQTHYKPYELPNGTESMLTNTNDHASGFLRERPLHIPNSSVPSVKNKLYFESIKFDFIFLDW